MAANAVNHLHFAVGIKFGKMSVASAKFKHRCKMSGEFTLLLLGLFKAPNFRPPQIQF
jgi:hypothetical protein